MPDSDKPSRYGPWLLAVAALIAAGSIGYRFYAEQAATSAAAQAAEANEPDAEIRELLARTQEAPDDAGAWQSLGWAYFRGERYTQAADAYRNAANLQPRTAVLWSSLGESLVMASERDPMPAEALDAFEKAHDLDATDPRARYFLAVARDLKGDHAGAIDDWFALLEDTPSGAPWETDLRRTIEQVGKINGIETAQRLASVETAPPMPDLPQSRPGPTRAQIQAAAALSPAEQRQMAEGMVAQLESRLEADPSQVDGWIMLIRSRMNLGQPDRAKAALAAAVRANPGAEARIRAEAARFGAL